MILRRPKKKMVCLSENDEALVRGSLGGDKDPNLWGAETESRH